MRRSATPLAAQSAAARPARVLAAPPRLFERLEPLDEARLRLSVERELRRVRPRRGRHLGASTTACKHSGH
jgi:hypothetical protein